MSVAVELALVYGGDLSLGSNADVALSVDTPNSPQATYERILRIVLTNPLTTDAQGNPLVRPDDLFHVNFGAGARAAIGEPYTPALVKAVNARIVAACNDDPYIAQNSVSVTWVQGSSPGTYLLTLSATSVSGTPFVLPPIPLIFASPS